MGRCQELKDIFEFIFKLFIQKHQFTTNLESKKIHTIANNLGDLWDILGVLYPGGFPEFRHCCPLCIVDYGS